MQQVGEIWRELDDEAQMKYGDWDYINELRLQTGLEPLADPEGLEPEDEDQETTSRDNHPHPAPNNPASQDPPPTNASVPMSKKSNYEAESECQKWVAKAVRDVCDFT